MAFLLKREVDDNQWSYEVQAFLNAIANGKSEAQAAADACIELEDLRGWKRKPEFRSAIKRARREGPRTPHFYGGNDPTATQEINLDRRPRPGEGIFGPEWAGDEHLSSERKSNDRKRYEATRTATRPCGSRDPFPSKRGETQARFPGPVHEGLLEISQEQAALIGQAEADLAERLRQVDDQRREIEQELRLPSEEVTV